MEHRNVADARAASVRNAMLMCPLCPKVCLCVLVSWVSRSDVMKWGGQEHPWRRCASAQIPFLVVSPGLFLTETRRELLSCCSAVGFAIVGNGVSIDLNTIDEVKSLDKSMRNSRKTAQTHLHRGGEGDRWTVKRCVTAEVTLRRGTANCDCGV